MAKKGPRVLKFGGTSMGSANAMKAVIDIVKNARAASAKGSGEPRAVVVSAMSGSTNQLIEMAKLAAAKKDSYKKMLAALKARHVQTLQELAGKGVALSTLEDLFENLQTVLKGIKLARELTPASLDYVMSFGERLSAHILADGFRAQGIEAEYLNARTVVATDDNFGSAAVDFKATNKNIATYFKKHPKLQIVTGFIGATKDGKTTTLGRGGSDYSAAIFGAALKASVIEIWTDVSGVFTADPRKVPGARVAPELAFEEAGELAYFGAKVLHPKTIVPAMREGIPVRVSNTFKPNDKGTTIVSSFAERKAKSRTVEALTFKKSVTVVHIQSPEFFDANGLMANIFGVFEKFRTSIDIVATSVAGVSLTIDNDSKLESIAHELKKYGTVSIEKGKAIVCAVGGSVNAAGVAGKMFTVLGKHKIAVELISQASGGVSITFVVKESDAEKALRVLHKEYIG